MKKLFTLFLTLFVASSVWADDVFEVDGIFYYILNENKEVAVVGTEYIIMEDSFMIIMKSIIMLLFLHL